jgi:hypothetical protein
MKWDGRKGQCLQEFLFREKKMKPILLAAAPNIGETAKVM